MIDVRVVANLVMLLLLLAGATFGHPPEPRNLEQQIDQVVDQWQAEQGVPGVSVAVRSGGGAILSKAYGLADVENHVAVTTSTRFRTASICKTFTAVAVMQLAEEGRIDLDQPVADYFPELGSDHWTFTTRQLLAHTAGVRHYKGGGESRSTRHFADVESALATFADDRLRCEPGTEFHYSTFGYNLLGALVQRRAEESFADYLNRQIVEPAGMAHTCVDRHYTIVPRRSRGYFRWSDNVNVPSAARSYLREGQLYNASLHDTSMKVPGGGMLSTPTDLVQFAAALIEGRLLSHRSLAAMWTEQQTTAGQPTGYGLGFRLVAQQPMKLVGHSGGQAGVTTFLILCPETGSSAAIMCNLERAALRSPALALLKLVQPATFNHASSD